MKITLVIDSSLSEEEAILKPSKDLESRTDFIRKFDSHQRRILQQAGRLILLKLLSLSASVLKIVRFA